MAVRGLPMVGFLFVGLGDVGRTTCRFRRDFFGCGALTT